MSYTTSIRWKRYVAKMNADIIRKRYYALNRVYAQSYGSNEITKEVTDFIRELLQPIYELPTVRRMQIAVFQWSFIKSYYQTFKNFQLFQYLNDLNKYKSMGWSEDVILEYTKILLANTRYNQNYFEYSFYVFTGAFDTAKYNNCIYDR